MYTAPLIAGTNRRPICCLLAMHWRTVTIIDHTLLISLEINNWCLCTLTYLWFVITVQISYKAIDQWGWRMIGHVIDSEKVELVKKTIWTFGDSHRIWVIDFKEVVIWSLIVRSDSCDWRCGRMSCWAGFREKRRWSDKHLYLSTVKGDCGWNRDVFMLKIASRW